MVSKVEPLLLIVTFKYTCNYKKIIDDWSRYMIKKISCLILLFFTTLYSQEEEARKHFSQHVLSHIAELNVQRKKAVIGTFRKFLKNGVIPDESISALITRYHQAFHDSDCEHAQATANLLRKVQNGQASEINGFTAITCFENTIKQYDENFKLSFLERTCAAVNGVRWFFSKK